MRNEIDVAVKEFHENEVTIESALMTAKVLASELKSIVEQNQMSVQATVRTALVEHAIHLDEVLDKAHVVLVSLKDDVEEVQEAGNEKKRKRK